MGERDRIREHPTSIHTISCAVGGNVMTRRFVFTYPGNHRPTGQVCQSDHEYDHPNIREFYGVEVGKNGECGHYTCDGYATEQTDDEILRDFLRAEHLEIGHVFHLECPLCNRW